MRLAACLLTVLSGVCSGQELAVRERAVSPREIRGAALARDGRLFTWGDSLMVRATITGRARVLARAAFGEGGCLVDLDGDGQDEFVGKEGARGLGPLTWRKPPAWKAIVLEAETDTHDCVEATLFGRKGVLAIHRHMQVRFYEPGGEREPWRVREIYSIYTPSRQTGLSLSDVDADGRTDILCGNYWIRSPESFEQPWHIFAINTWFESPDSAMQSHATAGDRLFFAQGHMDPARVAVFQKPADVRQLWKESPVRGGFRRVHAAVAAGDRVVFGENNGKASRIFELRDGAATELASGVPVLRLFPLASGLISVGPRQIVRWDYRRR